MSSEDGLVHQISAAATLAASLLAEACRRTPESSLQAQTVRALALDLKPELSASYGEDVPPDLLAEEALRCADLANLAACSAPDLTDEAATLAAASTHLAAGAAYALHALAGPDGLEDIHAQNLQRDARGALWRSKLAVRQVEEALEDRR